MHLLAPCLLLLAAAGDDPRADYDVLSYRLELEVDPERRRISGTVSTLARSLVDGLETLRLDLVDDMRVERVTVGDLDVAFRHAEDSLDCVLPSAAAEGDVVQVAVQYAGEPRATDFFSGFHWSRTPDGRPWINTSCQGPGAHSWWPCKASYFHPEDKPEMVALDVTVPAGLVAVSNGRQLDTLELEDGRRTFRWLHEYPLETYSVTLNVAPFVEVASELELPGHERPVPFRYWVLPQDAEKAAVQFAEVPRLLGVYCEAFGPFPFERAKFGLVQTNFWGMEHSTAVAYGSSFPAWCEANGAADPYASRNRFFDYILVHEVAHEWWGNGVSAATWGDFWIHEGFATYAEGVFVERTQGRERADEFFDWQGRMVPRRARLWRGEGKDSGAAYGAEIYTKGACVLNTLRLVLDDDEAWWRALREFNLRFRYRNASTEDFRAVVEELAERDLEEFFAAWVYGEGQPRLAGTVRAEGSSIVLELENGATSSTTFEVPLDLAFRAGGEPRSVRVLVPPGSFRAELEQEGPVTDLALPTLRRVLGRHDVEVAVP